MRQHWEAPRSSPALLSQPSHQPSLARCTTPIPAEIDQVGVQPDGACRLLGSDGPRISMSGIPVGPGASEAVVEELETDGALVITSLGRWLVAGFVLLALNR